MGSIAVVEGIATEDDGILQVAEHDDIQVTYIDDDFGGTGSESITYWLGSTVLAPLFRLS